MACEVRLILPSDHSAWLEMWRHYCDFYEVTISEEVTNTTWRRIVAADCPVSALIAISASTGARVGFANFVVHPFTWSDRSACYLEDLFVREEVRNSGVGRSLVEHLIALGRQHRWGRLYWMTHANNHVAQRLYDRFGKPDDFVRYVVTLDGASAD